MTRAALLQRLRSRKIYIPLIAVLIVAIAGIAIAVSRSSNGYRTVDSFVTGTPEPNGAPVKLDTTLYLPDKTPAPAVLLAQGFGGDKSGLAGTAQTLAEHGYVVLAYTARGFGNSGGLIHFDSPKYEVHDARAARRPPAAAAAGRQGQDRRRRRARTVAGWRCCSPRYDKRIKAVAADITWNDLQQALCSRTASSRSSGRGRCSATASRPRSHHRCASSIDDAADSPVPKPDSVSCGRFAPDVCAAYQAAATHRHAECRACSKLMRDASPASVHQAGSPRPPCSPRASRIRCSRSPRPTPTRKGIATNGTPVRVVWRPGGHDDRRAAATSRPARCSTGSARSSAAAVSKNQPFEFSEQGALLSSSSGRLRQQVRRRRPIPASTARSSRPRRCTLTGPPQQIGAPAGGTPAAITAVPGLSGILERASAGSRRAASALSAIPAQTAGFISPQLDEEPADRRAVIGADHGHGAQQRPTPRCSSRCAMSRPTARSCCPRSSSRRCT